MNTPVKKIFLIDGSSYLYRAFHAMPPLTTSTGLPTGAVKGVTNMLRNLRKENPDAYYLSIFDAKGKNFRHDLFKDYKANRPPMPEELREQLSPLKEICNAMGMPVIEIPKVEADDVIATLAEKGARQGMPVVISSLERSSPIILGPPDTRNTIGTGYFASTDVRWTPRVTINESQCLSNVAIVFLGTSNFSVGPKKYP